MATHAVEKLRKKIFALRRRRGSSKAYLPATIREEAIRLAAQHGTDTYAQLGIRLELVKIWKSHYSSFFRSVNKAAPASRPALKIPEKEKPCFVEIKAGPEPRRSLWPENTSSVVEVVRPDGWTLRVCGELAKDVVHATIGKISL